MSLLPPDAVPPDAFARMDLGAARRHVFLCVGPDCCATATGLGAWEHLKQALKATGVPALRTKAACLRICRGGPWMVVYPEGVWYGAVDAAKIDRIVREHLQGGQPVAEWVAARHPLPSPAAAS